MDFDKIMEGLADAVGSRDSFSGSVPYWLPTSLPNVNMAISGDPNLGFPGGRIITIAGPESCGKTALMTELMTKAQRMGGFSALEDFEHAFAHVHAKRLGLACDDTDKNWYYRKPATAEEGFARVYKIMRYVRSVELGFTLPKDTDKKPRASAEALYDAMRGVDLSKLVPMVLGMDSIASMIPEAQDVDYTKQNMKTKNMEHAALLSIELKRLARDADVTGATMILLNQLRTNPGVMFGDNSTEPGGNAPKFYASVMLRLRRVDKWYRNYDDKTSEVIGDVVELYTRKNKVFRPFKKTKYVFRTVDPVGLDPIGTMILLGKEAGVLGPVGGVTVEFDGKKRWNVNDFDEACRKDPDLAKRLTDHVMSSINPVEDGPVQSDDESTPAPGGIGSVDLSNAFS